MPKNVNSTSVRDSPERRLRGGGARRSSSGEGNPVKTSERVTERGRRISGTPRRSRRYRARSPAIQIFLVFHVSCEARPLCVPGTYASLHRPVRGVQAIPADKDKVTLRNCFPWDEAKPVGTLLAPAIFSSSFASSRSPAPLPPVFAHPRRSSFIAVPLPSPSFRLLLIPLQRSFLSTSFRRDARQQKGGPESKSRRERTREPLPPPAVFELRPTGVGGDDHFVTIAVPFTGYGFPLSSTFHTHTLRRSTPRVMHTVPVPGKWNLMDAIFYFGFTGERLRSSLVLMAAEVAFRCSAVRLKDILPRE